MRVAFELATGKKFEFAEEQLALCTQPPSLGLN